MRAGGTLTALALCALLMAGGSGAAAEGGVPLKIKLPKPVFLGTPKHVPKGTTASTNEPTKRPDLIVPAGTVLLSAGKDVTSSDPEPIIGELPLVTDGDKEATDGSYLELGPGLQYVQIDLGASCRIHAIAIWHYHGDPRVYHDVVVQASDDKDFITGVRTVYNNDQDNSAGLGVGKQREYFETYLGRLVETGAAKGRYVRLSSQGNTADEMNRYTEVEVYGLKAK